MRRKIAQRARRTFLKIRKRRGYARAKPYYLFDTFGNIIIADALTLEEAKELLAQCRGEDKFTGTIKLCDVKRA
jgi:hypothetical protein